MTPSQKDYSWFEKWTMASRPKTLPAAAAPVIAALALAYNSGYAKPGPGLAALLGALLLQIGANLANDVYDYQKGTDTGQRLGPLRVTQAGLLNPSQVKRGMWITFGLAALVGLYLIFNAGWPIMILGLFSIISAIAYTAGPYPLGYHGLGELFVFIFFGLVAVNGTYYIQAVSIGLPSISLSVSIGLLAVGILIVNNLRDIPTDRESGKNTLAVLFGAYWARREFLVVIAGAFLLLPVFVLAGIFSPWACAPWLLLLAAARLVRFVFSSEGPSLNQALARTGKLELQFALLISAGFIVERLIK